MGWKFYSADGSLLTKVPSAATATEATNVTVTTNNSEDASLWPVFVDGNSSTQGIEADDGLRYNPSSGLLTISGELDAGSLDISGDADIDGTMEADAITVDGTDLAEYITDTVGGMVTGNTETGITVTFEDGDNTLDFVVGTLNQDTTGTAAIATTATVSANNSNDETVYPVFVDAATGNKGLESDTGLTYNPSTGALTATSFTGSVSGTVTGAASQVTVTAVTDDDTVHPVFVENTSGASDPQVASALTYNPSTGLLSTAALTLTGDLTVGGTTTTVNSTTVTVDDKNLELGSVASPTDTTADGGGITLKGTTDKTIIWDNANDNWTSNQDLNVATGKVFRVNNVDTLNATTLGTAVVNSSLANVSSSLTQGTLTTASGSITDSSGAISFGDENLTTTGTVTAAGFTIGSAGIDEAELEILDGATVTTAELNLIDGDTARGTEAVASGDGILINDAGTMRMTNVDTVSTYFAAHSVGGTNIATVGTIGTGTWQGSVIAEAYLPNAGAAAEGVVELATSGEINTGTDSTRAMPIDQYVASNRNVRYILYRIIAADTDVDAATTVGGDFEFPFTGTIIAVGTYSDTAGVGGTQVVDINKNGTTIMSTHKCDTETTDKTTRDATQQPVLTTTAIAAGDILTFDVDAEHSTTEALGLTVRLEVRVT